MGNDPIRPASHTFGVAAAAQQISVFDGNGTGGNQWTDNTGVFSFPATVVGTGSGAQTFTIQNTGGTNLTGIAVTDAVTGNPGDFIVNTSGMATTLAANATTTFTVIFSPAALGSRSAVVQIASNDAITPSFRINVGGTAVTALVPQISVFDGSGTGGNQRADNTGTFSFPATLNSGNNVQTFTIENTGSVNLTGLVLTKAVSGNPGDFVVDTTGMATTLAANATTSFIVTFSPTALGMRSAVVQIASNDPNINPFRINVSGSSVVMLGPQASVYTGSGAGVTVVANSGLFTFPNTAPSSSSSAQTFTLLNSGTSDLTSLAITKAVTGNPLDFVVDTTGMLTTLAPSATTSFTVTFSPQTTGVRSAVVQIASNDPNHNPFTINVGGSSGAPQISLFSGSGTGGTVLADSDPFVFPNTAPGSSSSAQTFTLQNTGTLDLTGLSIAKAVTGTPVDFVLNTAGMMTTLAPNATTSFTVTFSSLAVGIRSAVVQIASNDPNTNPFRINVSGPSGGPQISVFSGSGAGVTALADPGLFNCPPTASGSSGSAQTFTIQNTGALDLTGLAITEDVTGNPGDFVVSAPGVTTLAANATTTFTVIFSPTLVGARTATVLIASNDTHTNPFHISLSGKTNTVSFDSAAQSQIEHAATVTVPVRLSSATGIDITKGFSVPVTFGGTATRANFIASPAATLTFAANKTVANITLTLIDDKILVTPDRTVIITLGTPSLTGVLLGTPSVFTLTLLDADTSPTITPAPASKIVKVGDAVTFTSGATGSAPLTYQWKKNGVAIAGATSATLNLANAAALTNAGAYSFTATNYKSVVTSSIAQLAVVDYSSSILRYNVNTTAIMTVNAAGNTLTYRWRNGSGDLPITGTKYAGVTTKTLSVKSLVGGDAGGYTCTVTAPGGSQPSGTFTLEVPIVQPSPITPSFPDSVAYNAYSYQLPYDAVTENQVPTKFVCAGLPPGLTCNITTGLITGKPTVARATAYPVTVTLSNGAAGSPTPTHGTITVSAFPTTCVGAYVGLMARDALNANLGGRVDVTTTATGSFTGSLKLGAASYPLAGTMVTAPPTTGNATPHPGITLTIARTGTTKVVLILDLDPGTNVLSGSINVLGNAHLLAITGWRNTWYTAAPAHLAAQAGVHTFEMGPNVASQAMAGIPRGFGYGTITVTSAGGTTVSGHTADGGVITSSTGVLGPNGEVVVYQMLYSYKGSVLGSVGVANDTDHTVSGTLDWQKTAFVVARDYAAFGPVTLDVSGGKYIVKTPVLGLTVPPVPDNDAQLVFDQGGLVAGPTNPGVQLRISSTNVVTIVTVAGSNPNPGKITALTLTPSTGVFSGKFTLTDGAGIRNATFQGQIVYPLGKGYGYFLLPQPADSSAIPSTTAATSPILSGSVEMQSWPP